MVGGGFQLTLCEGWNWFEPLSTEIRGSSLAGEALGNCGKRRMELPLALEALLPRKPEAAADWWPWKAFPW